MKITSKSISNIGGRKINEDSVGRATFQEGQYCFIVADGLGGHGKGDIASKTAVECAKKAFEEHGVGTQCLVKSFEMAQKAVLEKQQEDFVVKKMKTTMVVVHVHPVYVEWAHIGDSRMYIFHGGKAVLRTRDHSVPQVLADTEQIKEEEIRGHADRNMILAAIGSEWDTPKYQLGEKLPVEFCEEILLCTDGFWELITEKEMEQCLNKSKNVSEWIERMVKIVKRRGQNTSMDNFSAIGIWIGR